MHTHIVLFYLPQIKANLNWFLVATQKRKNAKSNSHLMILQNYGEL